MSGADTFSEPVPCLTTAKARPAATLTLPAILLLTLINFLWSASSAASKVALVEFGPFTLTLIRFLPSALLLLGMEWRQGHRPRFARSDWFSLLLLGVMGIALTYGIFYIGVARTNATDTSLLFACEPLFIAMFAVLFLRERLKPWQWFGLLAGILGVWLIAGQAGGTMLAVFALLIESSATIVGKRLAGRYRGLLLCGVEMLIGSLAVVPFALRECLAHPPHFTPAAAGCALYLCLICSAFCYGVWYRLLSRFPVAAMGAFILVQPLFGPIMGWLLHREPLKPLSAIGGLFIVAGLILATLIKTGRKEPAVQDR